MIPAAVASFLGAFAALVALGELAAQTRLVRYLGAFLVGLVFTVLLASFLTWVAGVFGHLGH